jgi:2-phosphoglycerate kinase
MSDATLQDQLRNVYWIGGGSAAGKSTIARRLATQHGLQVYATDDVMTDHARRSSRETSPLLHKFMAMEMDQRWVNRSPQEMFETFHWFRGECFNLIVEDLRGLNDVVGLNREVADVRSRRGVIAEGFRLLPTLVEPLLSERNRAVWLLPTPDFRRAVVEARGGTSWGFIAKTSDPERALHNLLDRDRLFTDQLREETARLNLHAIEVDVTTSEDDLIQRVSDLLGL